MENWYKFLEIKNFSDIKEVKQAYRNLSRKYHPDNFIGSSESEKQKSEKVQQKLNEIWQTLSDEKKKQTYDEKLKYELDRQKYSSYSKATNQNRKNTFSSQDSRKKSFSSQGSQKGFFSSEDYQKGFFSSENYQKGFFSSENYQKGFFSSEDYRKGFFSSYDSRSNSFSSQYGQKGFFSSQGNQRDAFSSQHSFSNQQKKYSQEDIKNTDDKLDKSNLARLFTEKTRLENKYIDRKSNILSAIKKSEKYKKLSLKYSETDHIIYNFQIEKSALENELNSLIEKNAIHKKNFFRRLFFKNKIMAYEHSQEEIQDKIESLINEINKKEQEKKDIEESLKQFFSNTLSQDKLLRDIAIQTNEINSQIEMLKSKFDKEPAFTTSEVKNDRNKK